MAQQIKRILAKPDVQVTHEKDKMEIVEKMSKVNKDVMETVFTVEEMRVVGGYSPIPEEAKDDPTSTGEEGFKEGDYQ